MLIDVRITPLISPSHLHLHFSPPSHLTYTYVCIQIYIHMLIHPPAPLFEPLVPLRVLLRVNSCGCVSKHVRTFPSSSIFIHTHRHPHMYGLLVCSVLYLSPSCGFLSSVSTNFIAWDTYVTVPIDGRTTCSHSCSLFQSVSSFLQYMNKQINKHDYLRENKIK